VTNHLENPPDPAVSSSAKAGKSLVEAVIRTIAEAYEADASAWPSKYGTEVDNPLFAMRPFCWCEEEICQWCGPQNKPNFHYKPLDFKLWWYKYIGRGMETNRDLTPLECSTMLTACLMHRDQSSG
jgi:hypothetical protein